jgi:hypothetical protein
MVHWLSHTQPRQGKGIADWDDKVDAFNLDHFWSQVRQTGARWIIFPFGQNTGLYCSPNTFLDREFPGLCSKRDLFREIAQRAKADGVRVIAYLPSEADAHPAETRRFWEWDAHPRDKSRFQAKYMAFIRAYAESIGDLLDGWWFDGCYNAIEKTFLRTQTWHSGRFDFPAWQAACRAGNSEAVIAMCRGANDPGYVFREQDYLAGECNDLTSIQCAGPLVDGMQWHTLLWIDCFWMHCKGPGPIDPPRFSLDDLYGFVHGSHRNGGGVTLNAGIYEDGTIAEASVDQLAALAARMKTDESSPIPQQ